MLITWRWTSARPSHGQVAELTWDQLRQLDAGQGQHIPTFRQALLWARQHGVRTDVDHKAGTVEAISAVIRETGMVGRVVKSVEDLRETCAALRTTIVGLSLEQLADPRFVAVTRQCGARAAVTLLGKGDNESEIRRVIGLGAQLLETDHPDWVAKVRQ